MRKLRGLAALTLIIALVATVAGCKSKPTSEEAVAVVNGEEITREYFDSVYEQVAQQMGGEIPEEQATEYKQQLLDMLIDTVLITQEAEERGADLSEESVEASITALMGESDEAKLEEMLKQYGMSLEDLRISVRDQMAREYLLEIAAEEYAVDEVSETYVNLDHILVSEETTANNIMAELEAGGDFATLAQENSMDSGSAVNGGNLGWAALSDFVPEFADAAEALAVDEISEPVESEYGFHIIRKNDEFKAGSAIEDAPEDLRAMLEQSSGTLALDAYVDELRADAEIEYLDETLAPAEDADSEEE